MKSNALRFDILKSWVELLSYVSVEAILARIVVLNNEKRLKTIGTILCCILSFTDHRSNDFRGGGGALLG